MPATPTVMTEQDYAVPYTLSGMRVSVLVLGEQTGSYEVVQLTGGQDGGFPAHHHPWAESVYILKGEVEFVLGEDITWGAPGTVIHLPAGVVHGFRFGQAGAVVLSIASRPGAARLYAALECALSAGQTDLGTLAAIGARYGFTLAGKQTRAMTKTRR